jgi:hypothetical protein
MENADNKQYKYIKECQVLRSERKQHKTGWGKRSGLDMVLEKASLMRDILIDTNETMEASQVLHRGTAF